MKQDHCNIKRSISFTKGFKEFESAQRTLSGIEVVKVIRKKQIADSRIIDFKTFMSPVAQKKMKKGCFRSSLD